MEIGGGIEVLKEKESFLDSGPETAIEGEVLEVTMVVEVRRTLVVVVFVVIAEDPPSGQDLSSSEVRSLSDLERGDSLPGKRKQLALDKPERSKNRAKVYDSVRI